MNLKLTRLIIPVLLLMFAQTSIAQSGKENPHYDRSSLFKVGNRCQSCCYGRCWRCNKC